MENRPILLFTAITSALAAGRAILDVYDSSDMGVEKKADSSPLTRADRQAHEIIRAALERFEIPQLSEEGKDIPFETRHAWPRMWVIDPLDGTKEFIKRNGEFTVNIALVEAGVPTMGVIYVPVADTLYFADGNQGAYKCERCRTHPIDHATGGIRDIDQLIQSSVRMPLPRDAKRQFTIMGSRSHATPELSAYVETMREKHGQVEFISAGSSLKICRVAEGRADIYPRLGPTMEWDTAAGHAIATASGARVVRHDDGRPLAYNKENLLNPWFIVERSPEHGKNA